MKDGLASARLPWRGPGPGRPEGLRLPPEELPRIRRQGVWRKRWRYLGAFCDELMLCAARVQVGPIGQTFWAVWDREQRQMHERTRILGPIARGEVWTEKGEADDTGRLDWAPGSGSLVRIEAEARADEDPVRSFLRTGGSEWVECVWPTGEDGGGFTWTRKRVVPVECDVRIGERRLRVKARGIEDESCGYHPHHTVWSWSAGVGEATDGQPLAWNLVSGINDPVERSERAVWIGSAPSEPGPVEFEGLEAISHESGQLEFTAECERAKEEKRAFIEYSYRQPFGTFSGTLPGGARLARGFGVMEHHDAHW